MVSKIKKEILERQNDLDIEYTNIIKSMLKDIQNKDFNLGLFTTIENLRKQNLSNAFNANTYLFENPQDLNKKEN